MTTTTSTAQVHRGTERYSKLPPAPAAIRSSDARRPARTDARTAGPVTASAIFGEVFRSMFGEL